MIINPAELKRRYLKRISGALDNEAYIGPESVSLDIQNTCNLNCQFCGPYLHPSLAKDSKDVRYLQWPKFVEIIKDCVELNVDQIDILGGEPTFHPLFKFMIRHLENQPLYTKLWTNATFPTEYCPEIVKADHIMVNLSAVDRKKYIELKGQDLFDQVVENIKNLVSVRNSVKPDLHIDIVYVLNKLNIDQKEEMRQFALQLGVNDVRFRTMDLNKYNQDVSLPSETIGECGNRTPSVCLNGWFNIIIKLDGKVSTCHQIRQMPLGNISNISFKGLWLSKHMMNVRLLGKHSQVQKMFSACQKCTYYGENINRIKSMDEFSGQ